MLVSTNYQARGQNLSFPIPIANQLNSITISPIGNISLCHQNNLVMKDTSFKIKVKNSKLNIVLIITDDIFAIFKILCRRHKRKKLLATKSETEEFHGCVVNAFINHDFLYIIVKRVNNLVPASTLTHEVFHTTGKILRELNINYYEDEEMFAHLMGELNSAIMNNILLANENLSYANHDEIKIKKTTIIL